MLHTLLSTVGFQSIWTCLKKVQQDGFYVLFQLINLLHNSPRIKSGTERHYVSHNESFYYLRVLIFYTHNSMKWIMKMIWIFQKWEVIKYKYFLTVFKYSFHVSILYLSIYFSDNLVFFLPTFEHKYLSFLLLNIFQMGLLL